MPKTQRIPDNGLEQSQDPSIFESLLDCHDAIREHLDVLEDVGCDLLSTGEFTDRHLAALAEILSFLDVVIPVHTADEEDSLFPELCRLSPEAAASYSALESVQLDHRGHGVLELRLKVAIMQHEAGAAGKLALEIANDYRYHLRKEEELLFPWAMEVLSEAGLLDQLAEEMRSRRESCGLERIAGSHHPRRS